MAVTCTCIYRCLQFRSLANSIAYEGEGRDGYRDQIVTCDVGVSLNSKTHPLFMKYSKWHKHTVLHIPLSELVSCAFSTIPICPFLIQRIFHSLVYRGMDIGIKLLPVMWLFLCITRYIHCS